jgi:hypothetical protein
MAALPPPCYPLFVKKFLLFSYYAGRPQGGAKDFVADFDSLEEALASIMHERRRYFQLVDRDSMQVIREGLALFKRCTGPRLRRESPSYRRTE